MTRTRLLFFVFLSIILAIVALSLAIQLIDAQALTQIYIAATIFAAGIVILDFLGIFGDDGAHGDAHVGGHDAGHSMDFDTGDMDGGHLEHTGHDIDIDASRGQAALSHSATAAIATLAYLRLSVYFAIGFGPTGWMAMASGYSPWTSLAIATPVGVIAVILAQVLFRFQRSDTDSSLRHDDLLMQRATVIIPLTHKTMGKVRVQVGMNVVELYALAADAASQFDKGEDVRIVRVTEDCVYVA
jgi:membrane protein implicated in regulation of membrane protease activity